MGQDLTAARPRSFSGNVSNGGAASVQGKASVTRESRSGEVSVQISCKLRQGRLRKRRGLKMGCLLPRGSGAHHPALRATPER